MRKSDVIIGQTYTVKVSGKLVPVRVVALADAGNSGYWAINTVTGRRIRIQTAGRLRMLSSPSNAGKAQIDALARSQAVNPDVAVRLTQLIGYPPENV